MCHFVAIQFCKFGPSAKFAKLHCPQHRALARILKLSVIFERAHVQNDLHWSEIGLKLYEMVQNGHLLPVKNEKLPVKMMGMTGCS